MNKKIIKITGDGSVGGGTYEQIKIMGNGRVMDGVEAAAINVIGNGRFEGVKAEKISATGNINLNGDYTGGFLKVTGAVRVRGSIKNKEVKITGELRAYNIKTNRFELQGTLETESLNANNIEINLYGRSQVKEIGAEKIEVSNKGILNMLRTLVGGPSHSLEADIIEANSIHLEKTTAKTVKGNTVSIGPGCKIDLVEFKDSVLISSEARVGQTVQIMEEVLIDG